MPESAVDGETVVLAALLHDIGMLWQRTGAPAPADTTSVTEDGASPGDDLRWSAAGYQQIVPDPWRHGGPALLTPDRRATYAARVVALADRLATGEDGDREPSEDPRAARLRPVFAGIRLDDSSELPDAHFALEPLQLAREVIFPRTGRPPATAEEYRRLWDRFSAEASGLRTVDGFIPYVTALLALLEKYTWCVPSATHHERPDVSLYDHLRITAALAACLWQTQPDDSLLDALLADRTGRTSASLVPCFALLAGDLSGVQRFLYTIASRGAARTLRGRSIFLQLLSEAAADYVLRRLELPPPNLLYVGGAKFYILAPARALERLPDLRQRLDAIFLEITDGELALALEGIALGPRQVARHFGQALADVGARLQEAKSRRFGAVARSHYARLFEPIGTGGPVSAGGVCDVCRRGLGPDESAIIRAGVLRCARCTREQAPERVPTKICVICRSEVREGVRREGSIVCGRCDGFRDLGEAAAHPGALFLTTSDAEPPADAPEWQRALARFGRLWELGPRPRLDRPGALAWAVNDLDFRPAGAHGFRLSGVVVPLVQAGERPPRDLESAETQRPGAIKSFEWLARSARGVHYLGVLRMDVDSLGRIFRDGLGERATPSRMASLSRSLRLFFEGWLGHLVRTVDQTLGGPGQHLAVIYSGGDDLFVVGPWNRLPELARTIRRELAAFCANNPALTVSAGIAVADVHYPLYQFANEAKKALDDRAKQHQRASGRKKDALCFLETVVGWEDADAVFDSVSRLERLVGGDSSIPAGASRVPRALVHTLSRIAEEHRQHVQRETASGRWAATDPNRLYYGRWLWMAHYQLRRLAERIKDTTTRQEIANLTDALITPARVDTLGLVARWAEYLVRQEEDR